MLLPPPNPLAVLACLVAFAIGCVFGWLWADDDQPADEDQP